MQSQLKVSFIQSHLYWENPVANRAHFEKEIRILSGTTDLVVLPEMFTTGFSMNASELAESMQGETMRWMLKVSREQQLAICGSVIIQENNSFYNRFLFVTPSGEIQHYDKRHTFNMAGEGKTYQAGKEQKIVEYLGWKFMLQVCYDLRFPVFARNTANYDVLLYVANWPKSRVSAWDTLLKARAIENMSYTIGVNRIGLDGNGLEYVGNSAVYNVVGDAVAFAKAKQTTITVSLSKDHIKATRSKLPFLQDRDDFKLV